MIGLCFLLLAACIIGIPVGFVAGYFCSRGRWKKVRRPLPHQDPAHFWVPLDGGMRAFTGEQLQVARDRAQGLEPDPKISGYQF